MELVCNVGSFCCPQILLGSNTIQVFFRWSNLIYSNIRMWRNLWRNSSTLLTQQQGSILSAAFVIMAMMFISKILGVVKLRLLIHYFGGGTQTAAFIAANGLPEVFFDILISSVLSVSFIPIFTSYLAKDDRARASRLASAVINLTLIIYTVAAIVAFIFANQVAFLLAPGLVHNSLSTLHLVSSLIRMMLLAQFFLIIGGYLTAILQSNQRFLVPAIASTLYNVSVILGIMLFARFFGIYAAVVGMILGGFLQCVIQIPFLKPTQFQYSLLLSPKIQGVKQIAALSIPRMIGATSSLLVDRLDIVLASLTSAVAIISLDYASRLEIVPVSLFGAAIAQAALPALTMAWAKDKKAEFLSLFTASFNQILFLVLPIAAIFIVLRLPIVRLLFGDPRFTWEATVTTGRNVAVFGLGLIGDSMIMLLARSFYAMQDTKTPVIVSGITFVLHAVLATIAIAVLRLPIWWLAGIFSLTTLTNAAILLILLVKRMEVSLAQIMATPIKLIACMVGMIIVMYLPLRLMDLYVWQHIQHIGPFIIPDSLQLFILDTRYTVNVIILTVVAAVLGSATYLLLSYLLHIEEVNIVQLALRRMNGVRRVLAQSGEIIESER